MYDFLGLHLKFGIIGNEGNFEVFGGTQYGRLHRGDSWWRRGRFH